MLAQVNEDFIIFEGSVFIPLFLSSLRSALFKVYIPPPKIYICTCAKLDFLKVKTQKGQTFLTVKKSSASKTQLPFRYNNKVKRTLGLKTKNNSQCSTIFNNYKNFQNNIQARKEKLRVYIFICATVVLNVFFCQLPSFYSLTATDEFVSEEICWFPLYLVTRLKNKAENQQQEVMQGLELEQRGTCRGHFSISCEHR